MTVSRKALLLFFVSCFSACADKPQNNNANPTPVQAVASPTSTPRVDRPQLVGLIKNVSIYPVPGQPNNAALSLVVTISNSGVVTNASDFKLEVTANKRSFSSGIDPVHVNGVVEMPGTASKTVDLGKEDLALKARENSIGPGQPLEGILTFVLPNTSEKELAETKSGLTLLFKDKTGNSYQTARAVIGEKKE
jgi:hypothetical protein